MSTAAFNSQETIASRYVVRSTLGSGGFGTVYAAFDNELERPVAIKVLRLASNDNAALTSAQRFMREAKALSRLEHPNIVRVHHIGTLDQSQPFIVMDLIEGRTLRAYLQEKQTVSCSEATAICLQIARALEHAHNAGVIHRDLKPENILITENSDKPQIHLVDFGLSKILDSTNPQNKLTQTGQAFGTAEYMSPEQCEGRAPDARSDIYSLGCIYYELLAGRSPFASSSPMQTLWSQVHAPPPSLNQAAKFPPGVQQALSKMLEKEPDKRFGSCSELIRSLEDDQLLSSTARLSNPLEPGDADPAPPAGVSRKPSSVAKAVVIASTAIALLATTIIIFADKSAPGESSATNPDVEHLGKLLEQIAPRTEGDSVVQSRIVTDAELKSIREATDKVYQHPKTMGDWEFLVNRFDRYHNDLKYIAGADFATYTKLAELNVEGILTRCRTPDGRVAGSLGISACQSMTDLTRAHLADQTSEQFDKLSEKLVRVVDATRGESYQPHYKGIALRLIACRKLHMKDRIGAKELYDQTLTSPVDKLDPAERQELATLKNAFTSYSKSAP